MDENFGESKPHIIDGILQPVRTAPLPEVDIWNFMLPYLQHWSKRDGFVAILNDETGSSLSYSQVISGSISWSVKLQSLSEQLGLSSPQHMMVTFLLPNCLEYPSILLGNYKLGIKHCHLSVHCSSEVLTLMINDVSADVLLVDNSFMAMVEEFLPKLKKRPHIIINGGNDTVAEASINSNRYELFSNIIQWDCNTEDLLGDDVQTFNLDAPSQLYFSSGTTGAPKAIQHSNRTFLCLLLDIIDVLGFKKSHIEQEVIINNLSMTHIAAEMTNIMLALVNGNKIVHFTKKGEDALLELIQHYKPRTITARPWALKYYNTKTDISSILQSVSTIVSFGSIIDFDQFEMLNEKCGGKMILQQGYGTTEAGFLIIGRKDMTEPNRMHGRPVLNTYIKIVDLNKDTIIVAPGKQGEILIKSHKMMLGYFNNAGATEAAFTEDGYFKTGDIGHYDVTGAIKVMERVKDVIQIGGNIIYPSEFESILQHCDDVNDSGIVGLPVEGQDGKHEEMIHAFVVLKNAIEEEKISSKKKEIVDFFKAAGERKNKCDCEISCKCNKMWEINNVSFIDVLPRNALGKLDRKFLRRMAWKDLNKETTFSYS